MHHLQRLLKHPAGDLLLTTTVLRQLHCLAWDSYPNETGGILLGHTYAARRERSVTCLIGPGPEATHDATRFVPDHAWQAARVAELWQRSPALEYLGDWHTHPGGTTSPSELDQNALRVIADFPEAQQPQPIMLIVALSPTASSLGATIYSHGKHRTLAVRIRE